MSGYDFLDLRVIVDRGQRCRQPQTPSVCEKSRLPAIYGNREYVEAGGLMAYGVDPCEAGRRIADDVHEILNGAKPGDIPIS